MRTGSVEWHLVSDGTFRLDGGAMFGVVPRTMWEKRITPDDRNRIRLGTTCLLIRSGGRTVLVDTGIGTKEAGDPRFRDIYGIGGEMDVLGTLAARGVAPADVDIVVCTHLHFDHAGGGTMRPAEGEPCVPTFPNARYLVHATELHDAKHPTVRSSASYFPENWEPLAAAGQMDVVGEEVEIVPGVRTWVRPGHNRAVTGVLIESDGEKALFPSDNLPTSMHVPVPWVMGYDLYPLDTVATKEALLPQVIDEEWTLIFQHDPEIGAGKVRRDGKRLVVEPVCPAPTAASEG